MAWLLSCSICIALVDGLLIVASPAINSPLTGKAKALYPASNERVTIAAAIQLFLALLPIQRKAVFIRNFTVQRDIMVT